MEHNPKIVDKIDTDEIIYNDYVVIKIPQTKELYLSE